MDKKKLKEIMDNAKEASKKAQEAIDSVEAYKQSTGEELSGLVNQPLPNPPLAQPPQQTSIPSLSITEPQEQQAQTSQAQPTESQASTIELLNNDALFRSELLVRLDLLIEALKGGK